MPSLLYPAWIAEYAAALTELTGRTWTRPAQAPAPGDTAEWVHDEHGELLRLCAYLAPSEFGGTTFAERVLITAEIAPGRPRPHPHGHAATAPLYHAATAAAITHRELLTPQGNENTRSTWGNDMSPALAASTRVDDGPDEIVDQLTELAERNGIESEDLEDLVHDVASREASQTNNDGLAAQLRLLLHHLSAAEITDHLASTNGD
ncbi:hypothetical protein [Nocardia carnea]|uniref:hypothetical protein n=1 Tax=Nocardia carnea TaxID=37328 RepID=UPI002457AB81|nr:hypothetical protein [Nocardia carnea]